MFKIKKYLQIVFVYHSHLALIYSQNLKLWLYSELIWLSLQGMLFIYFLLKLVWTSIYSHIKPRKLFFPCQIVFCKEAEKGIDYEKRQSNNGEFKLFMCTNNEIHQSIFHSFYTLTMTKRSQHNFSPQGIKSNSQFSL